MVITRTLQQSTSYDKPYWVSYSDFHYSEQQIRWLIENEESFEEGCWPREPASEYITEKYDRHEKRYVEWIGCGMDNRQPGHSPKVCEGLFCKAAEIYGEVIRRIEATGKDGKLLLAQIRAGYTCLDEDASDALGYIGGQKTKLSKYADWLRQRRRRRNL